MARRLASILAISVGILAAGHAAASTYFLAPNGTDENDCGAEHPCATLQKAGSLCLNGQICSIVLAPGHYKSQALDVIYFRVVSVLSADSDCGARSSVIVEGKDGLPIFRVQDHAILTVQCLTLRSATPAVAFSARQYAIGDVFNVDFDGPLSISATEMARVNIHRPGGHVTTGGATGGVVSVNGQTTSELDHVRNALRIERDERRADRIVIVIAFAVMALAMAFLWQKKSPPQP